MGIYIYIWACTLKGLVNIPVGGFWNPYNLQEPLPLGQCWIPIITLSCIKTRVLESPPSTQRGRWCWNPLVLVYIECFSFNLYIYILNFTLHMNHLQLPFVCMGWLSWHWWFHTSPWWNSNKRRWKFLGTYIEPFWHYHLPFYPLFIINYPISSHLSQKLSIISQTFDIQSLSFHFSFLVLFIG